MGEKKKNQWMILGLRFGLFLSALAVMAVFAGSFMKILGMTYDGIGSLILFFVAASVIGYILNLAAGVLIGLFYAGFCTYFRQDTELNPVSGQAVLVFTDILTSVLGFLLVDECMDSVSAGMLPIATVSILFAFATAFLGETQR